MKQYALAIWLVSGFLAFAQSPTIKIRIDDTPRISAEILRKAEKEAGALLESGGIKVIWRDCFKADGCEHQLAADELILGLRARSPKANQEGTQDYALGGASTNSAGTGVSGWVNYDLVQVVATRRGVAPELLLASAIAHEIGHLLGLGHEPLGLMQAHWGSREMPQLARAYLHFNRKQRERLQAEVLVRMAAHQQAGQNRNSRSITSKQTFLDEQLRQEIDDRLGFRHPGSEHPIEVAVGTTLSADREGRSFRFKRRIPSCLVGRRRGKWAPEL